MMLTMRKTYTLRLKMNLQPLDTIPDRMVDNVIIVRYWIKSIESSLLDSSLLHLHVL